MSSSIGASTSAIPAADIAKHGHLTVEQYLNLQLELKMEQLKARAELKISELMASAALEKQRLREEISAVASGSSAPTGRAPGV